MAKKNPKNTERRALVEQMRQEQARKERRRSMLILGGCIVVVLGLLAAALVPYLKDQHDKNVIAGKGVDQIGATKSAAGCDAIVTKSAQGSGQHKTTGVPLTYDDAPPAFGPHWPNYLQGSEIRSFYSPDDRPEKERLVHSLEHGHTIYWYDETITKGSQEYQDLEDIASKFSGNDYFMTAPWTKADGGSFPEGKHVALTHWTGPDNQKGVWQYCAKPSGEVVKDFTTKYQPDNAPEPGAP
ncbi:DUF3105 domain-containing protein [Marmoricola sp. RAF53]|uniref:DUF3105 domain-containing protein n=1 Tax=Marmoricola sp. RAF53 TaxID=3233059 RepID=UPI003F9875BD